MGFFYGYEGRFPVKPGMTLGRAGMTLGQSFFQPCKPSGAAVVADGLVEGAGSRKNPHVAFGAGDGCVD